MRHELENTPIFGFDGEPEGYGYFGSFDDLEEAIALRQALGRNPWGAAVIYEGARIIRDKKGNEYLEFDDPNTTPYPISVHVGPGGGWVIPD